MTIFMLDIYKIMLDKMLVFTKKEEKMKKSYNFNDYSHIEMSILSCILLQPQNLDNLIVSEQHFIKYKKLFIFFKKFYSIYHNLDITLMFNLCPKNFDLLNEITLLIDYEPAPSLCETYQKMMLQLYNEKKNEKKNILKIYNLTNDLILRTINVEDFKKKVSEIDESKS